MSFDFVYQIGGLHVQALHTSEREIKMLKFSGRVFANGPGDRGLIKWYLIPPYLTQHYKGKVVQSRERCSALP